MSGYWATGRLNIATAPASVMTIEMTEAKIGRSMQKCEMFTPASSGLWTCLRVGGNVRPALARGRGFFHRGGFGRSPGRRRRRGLRRLVFREFQRRARRDPDRAV